MNQRLILLLFTAVLFACTDIHHAMADPLLNTTDITVTVGDRTFAATVDDTETGRAFLDLLPLTITMNELNGNEKYHYLTSSLPTDTYRPGTIQAGDLMLYGSDCLVLFYETFSSGYSYTRIGRLTAPEDLASAVGSGNISVSFSRSTTTAIDSAEQQHTPRAIYTLDGKALSEA